MQPDERNRLLRDRREARYRAAVVETADRQLKEQRQTALPTGRRVVVDTAATEARIRDEARAEVVRWLEAA